MSQSVLFINSDFSDYYDSSIYELGIPEPMTYNRYRIYNNKCKSLKALREVGVETIEILPVNQMIGLNKSSPIVVYTNITKHGGLGKEIMNFSEASMMCPNALCSRIDSSYDGLTHKYIQVGQRRFWVTIKNKGLFESEILGVKEIERAYNALISLPIFSIDYTIIDGRQVATDFNTVQKLIGLGVDDIVSPESAIYEIYYSLRLRGQCK